MYVSRLVVRNFRNFRHLDVALQPGVTCIVGENNTGKTNLLHAIRLAVDATLSSYRRQALVDDFPVGIDTRTPQQIVVSLEFSGFAQKPNEEAMVFGYHVSDDVARVTYRFRPKRDIREAIANNEHPGTGLTLDDYRWEIVGGAGQDPATVEWDVDFGKSVKFDELQQSFLVMTMEPLRDVEQRLRQSRSSPLSRLLTPTDVPTQEQEELVEILRDANDKISASTTVQTVGTDIGKTFDQTAGSAFTMGVRLGMASPSFNDISRGLNVLLSNDAMQDFDVSRNGLGLNNILYISMLLRYFQRRVAEAHTAGQLLLIEEPEAHLHPQLQRVLFRALRDELFQTIVTSHSTHVTSQAELSSVVVLTNDGTPATASTIPVNNVPLSQQEAEDLERYLDATRGTLLYARKVMLVEGPAELFLIPQLVQQIMGVNLDENGISVIPIHGVHFPAYAKLFGPTGIHKRCAIVADGDLEPSDATPPNTADGNDELPEISKPELESLKNEYVELFLCQTTFEKAITHRGTLLMLAATAEELGAPVISKGLAETEKALGTLDEQSPEAQVLLEAAGTKVLNTAKRFGKARFAQVASKKVAQATWLPPYIEDAVTWLTQGQS
ncbi:MAG: AAA family ATPase [Phycisphaerae bacterium]|nr:AAA family ATPase [Phycisphaerae bacterium]